ncbi:HAMP domain-containing histidine kinase [Aerophototrophica crusticola]|uniref:histidine kinase n=1 Tax=Aerophototrophica crusticola TaxID=1709002 RepID=A0A858R7Q7_9PROT|nr:HAMP domain-containing histidine kinase [Rhodospirillaceae bacterium B3]
MDRATLLARIALCLRARLKQRALVGRVQKLEAGLNDRNQRLADAMDLLRAAERRLSDLARQSEGKLRQRTDMMANAAHELRTPLHAIIGFADLIRQEAYGKVGDPRYAEYADDIHQAARQLLDLVDGTLDLARAESGADGLDIREVDIGRAVQDSVRMLRQLADGSGVTLKVVVPDTPLRIRTDPEKVRQIVLNLASNAIKFTPSGGTVTVEVTRAPDDGAIIMVVRDTGIGMSSQDIPTALRPFGQVRRPDRPHPKGTGLGLPLTKRFVELLGGRLEIESQPGKGTMVRVVLPATAPQGSGIPQAEVA